MHFFSTALLVALASTALANDLSTNDLTSVNSLPANPTDTLQPSQPATTAATQPSSTKTGAPAASSSPAGDSTKKLGSFLDNYQRGCCPQGKYQVRGCSGVISPALQLTEKKPTCQCSDRPSMMTMCA